MSYGDAFCLLLPTMLVGVSDWELLGVGCLVLPCFQMISTHLKYPLPSRLPHGSLRRRCTLKGTMESRLLPGQLSFPAQSQALTTYSEEPLILNYGFIIHFIYVFYALKKRRLRAAAIVEVPRVPPGRALGGAGTCLGGLCCSGAPKEQHPRREQQAWCM